MDKRKCGRPVKFGKRMVDSVSGNITDEQASSLERLGLKFGIPRPDAIRLAITVAGLWLDGRLYETPQREVLRISGVVLDE